MQGTLYTYGIIGTGIPHGMDGATGFGMAHGHWPAFRSTGRVQLTAIAEPNTARADFFCSRHEVAPARFGDYRELLADAPPDIVSICTWPHQHAEMVIAAARAGVRAIHCEKPMAMTWGECLAMMEAVRSSGAVLTLNHQRRHIRMFGEVRSRIAAGDIGQVVQIEAVCGDLFDWGTHWLDMMFFYNQDQPADWVIGQLDLREEVRHFGALKITQAVTRFKWRNGVLGVMVTGDAESIGCVHRIIGDRGLIEVLSERSYRIMGSGTDGWTTVEVPQGEVPHMHLAAADVVRALDEPPHVPLISASHSIQHTEVIFATYESSRSRARIDLPLQSRDSALLDLVNRGKLGADVFYPNKEHGK